MRKLKDLIFYSFLLVPAIGIIVGIQYAMKKGPTPEAEHAVIEKKSEADAEDAQDSHHKDSHRPKASPQHVKQTTPIHKEEIANQEAPHLAEATPVEAKVGEKTSNACVALEYPGDAASKLVVKKDEWTSVMKYFHKAKDDYLKWLDKNKSAFSTEAYQFIEKRIRFARIQRPPVFEEPDLAWRGVVVWSMDQNQEPLIRVGGGFMKLVKKHPARARFEMARVIAQGFNSCELQKMKYHDSFAEFSKCMKVSEANACAAGSYSESGWAVSTALASKFVKLDCQIPAFENADAQKCFKDFDESMKVGRTWKEAHL